VPDSNASIMRLLRDHEITDENRFGRLEDKLNAVINQNKVLGALIVAAGIAAFFGHG